MLDDRSRESAGGPSRSLICNGGIEAKRHTSQGTEWGMSMLNTHDQRTGNVAQSLNSESATDPVQARLADALVDLHNLLKAYAPSWYTQEHHTKVESALQLLTKH